MGRIVASFYDICSEIWRRSYATESIKSGKENTLGGIKAGEIYQPEELSNAHNGFSHDNNANESLNDEKHWKTLQNILNKQQ